MCFARKGFTDEPTQASIHPLCKFSELNPWTKLCNRCLLQRPTWLGALQCSREEMECNFAAQATQPTVATDSPWLARTSSLMMSQGCGSHANISSCRLCPLLKICISVSLGYSSCLADRQQPGIIIGDHNLKQADPCGFCPWLLRLQHYQKESEKIKHDGISI